MQHAAEKRSVFYGLALRNLGVAQTIARGLTKRFGSGELMRLNSRFLDYPVKARRGTTDLLVFDMIFVEREYAILDRLKDVRTIVDAGGNVGYSSAYLLSKFPESRTVAIEPDADNFRLMQKNLAPWVSRATCFEGALWSHATKLSFSLETTVAGREWGRRTQEGEGEIDATDMPTLLRQVGMERVDILKMDIEGAERTVFSGDTSWLDNVRNLVIEFHGDDCEETVLKALQRYDYRREESGELSIFFDLQHKS